MNCKKCGFEYDEGDKFCFNCGEPISQSEGKNIGNSGSAKSKVIVVGIILAVVVVLGAVILTIVLSSGNKKLPEESAPSSAQSTPAETLTTTTTAQTTSTAATTTTTATTTTAQTTVPVEEPEVDNTIPMNLRADNFGEKQQIQVSWNTVDGADQYLVSILDGDKLVRTDSVSEPKCVVTGLEDGKQYTFKVQAFVDLKWSDYSEEIKAKTLSREDAICKELNDYLLAIEEDNKIQPIYGTGDLFCTVGDYEIHIKKEESFSGDKTYLGVYNKTSGEWIVPYTTDSQLLTDGRVNIDGFLKKRKSGTNRFTEYSESTRIEYEGGTVISCVDYLSSIWGSITWFYDYSKDKCVYSGDDSQYLYHTSDEIVLYDMHNIFAINWNTREKRILAEGYIEDVLDNAVLIDFDYPRSIPADNTHLALIDYEGNTLIDLSSYNSKVSRGSCQSSYNGDKLLAIMYGKESGIYACLINSDSSLAFDPIKLASSKVLLYLFDDFFVIVRGAEDDPEQGIYFYELDGSQIMRLDLE